VHDHARIVACGLPHWRETMAHVDVHIGPPSTIWAAGVAMCHPDFVESPVFFNHDRLPKRAAATRRNAQVELSIIAAALPSSEPFAQLRTAAYYAGMTKRERDLLALRYMEIDAELAAIAEGRVVDGDPAEVEADLLDEQDEIEYTLGEQWFDDRDAGVNW
jgi:hypothetical protein